MNEMRHRQWWVVAVMLLATGVPATVRAVCDQTAASQSDQDLWNTHGCWNDYFLWQYRAYGMRQSDWSGRGWTDACNVLLEYPKHWNASYLVNYGLIDNNDQSFHGTVDYRATAEAASSNFHDGFRHVPSDRTDVFGAYGSGQVTTACLLYSTTLNGNNSNPASRGGDFMHEGWHAYFSKYGWNNGSYNGHRAKQGACQTSNFCDYFYFHGIATYVFGDLWTNDGTASRFHSPNQVQVEYLCDVSDQPQRWVPASVSLAAAADANTRSAQRFINGPGYTCGSPRPW